MPLRPLARGVLVTVRRSSTLAEVARAQIRTYIHQGREDLPEVLRAWQQAKHLKTAEEYRLLYVAMTRAKRLLWMSAEQQAPFSWSKPESLQPARPCPAWSALQTWRQGVEG